MDRRPAEVYQHRGQVKVDEIPSKLTSFDDMFAQTLSGLPLCDLGEGVHVGGVEEVSEGSRRCTLSKRELPLCSQMGDKR